MQYLTLEEIKKQCVIDPQFTEDDSFLEMIGDAAEDMTAQLLDCPLADVEAHYGQLPATIQHAMRILVDYYYAVNRGSSDNDKEIPEAVFLMLKLFRQFN